jgi:hypothetical protein
LEEDTELFIGPAPPAVVAEAASANEAERFEEVLAVMHDAICVIFNLFFSYVRHLTFIFQCYFYECYNILTW